MERLLKSILSNVKRVRGMKIYIKEKDQRGYTIPVPLGLAQFFLNRMAGRVMKKYVKDEDLQNIDFKQLSKALDELKGYKGLKLVEVKEKDGDEVTIII